MGNTNRTEIDDGVNIMKNIIFLGGIGRSGTSFMTDFVAEAQNLYRVPMESKFICEAGGLADLEDALSVKWTPTGAILALRNIDKMLRYDLTGWGNTEYRRFVYHHQFDSDLNKSIEHYFSSINSFIERISEVSFIKQTPPHFTSTQHTPNDPVAEFAIYAKKMSRQEIIEEIRLFLQVLFGKVATKNNYSGWVEKTPSNIYVVDFLLELFPEARFIHCIRDPINVAMSYCRQPWASPNIEENISLLKMMYERIIEIDRKYCDRDSRYLCLRLEELHLKSKQEELAYFLGCSYSDLPIQTIRHHKLEAYQPDWAKPIEFARDYFGYTSHGTGGYSVLTADNKASQSELDSINPNEDDIKDKSAIQIQRLQDSLSLRYKQFHFSVDVGNKENQNNNLLSKGLPLSKALRNTSYKELVKALAWKCLRKLNFHSFIE